MILDLVKNIIGDLPLEFEFIYYIATLGLSIVLIAIPISPILVIMRNLGKSRR